MANASTLCRSLLLSFPSITALVGQRVSVSKLPNQSIFPAVVVWPESGETEDEAPWQRRTMLIVVRAESAVDAISVYEAVKAALITTDQITISGVVLTAWLEGTEMLLFDEDLSQHICQFKIEMATQQ